jgi:hypothetical protein
MTPFEGQNDTAAPAPAEAQTGNRGTRHRAPISDDPGMGHGHRSTLFAK